VDCDAGYPSDYHFDQKMEAAETEMLKNKRADANFAPAPFIFLII
jgi:hypothetical protein